MDTDTTRIIAAVYLWQNDMVMVFDQYGEQMLDYQGPVDQVKAKIDAVYTGAWTCVNWLELRQTKLYTSY